MRLPAKSHAYTPFRNPVSKPGTTKIRTKETSVNTAKEEVKALLAKLPDDCFIEAFSITSMLWRKSTAGWNAPKAKVS